ncbi:hypothetical protein ACFQZ4_31235 [Catellatospora coxensis]
MRWVDGLLHEDWVPAPAALVEFIGTVRAGVETADRDFPFLAYGTDWLAFAHLVIAMAFYGPLRDPVRNLWVIHWGMLCCVAVIPLALIAAPSAACRGGGSRSTSRSACSASSRC